MHVDHLGACLACLAAVAAHQSAQNKRTECARRPIDTGHFQPTLPTSSTLICPNGDCDLYVMVFSHSGGCGGQCRALCRRCASSVHASMLLHTFTHSCCLCASPCRSLKPEWSQEQGTHSGQVVHPVSGPLMAPSPQRPLPPRSYRQQKCAFEHIPTELTTLILRHATSRDDSHQDPAHSSRNGSQDMAQVATLRLVCAEFRDIADRQVLHSLTLTSWPGPSRKGVDLVGAM